MNSINAISAQILYEGEIVYTPSLKEEHRENLLILAEHLLKKPTVDPLFTMGTYATAVREEGGFSLPPFWKSAPDGKHPCGTVHCAAGSAVEIDLPQFRPIIFEDWSDYTRRLFGIRNVDDDDDSAVSWEWLFAGEWESIDNTSTGAAMRILFFLKYGVPVLYESIMLGSYPLCYPTIAELS